MKKQIKVRGEFHWDFKDFFVTKILSKKYNLSRVDKNPDLTIGLVEPRPFTKQFLSSPRSLLVSGENLYYKINLFKFLEYLTKKTRIPFEKFNKILPKVVLNMKLGLMRPKYYQYIKRLAKNPKRGKYAIISNGIKGENILNLPFFLQRPFNTKDFEKKKKVAKVPKKFCCLIISNESAFDRIDFAKKLSKYKKVDIYGGTSLTNSDNSKLPKSWVENFKFYSQYKFVICFENSFAKEYLTEKLPNAMLGGSIPIYRGAPNISKYFNTKSFINFDDYGSYDKMIKKIIELDKDDEKYLEVFNKPWMKKENIEKIEKKEKELRKFLKRVLEE